MADATRKENAMWREDYAARKAYENERYDRANFEERMAALDAVHNPRSARSKDAPSASAPESSKPESSKPREESKNDNSKAPMTRERAGFIGFEG